MNSFTLTMLAPSDVPRGGSAKKKIIRKTDRKLRPKNIIKSLKNIGNNIKITSLELRFYQFNLG